MVSTSNLMRTARLGVSSLLLHKLRSFLTTLGVLFGVASVIAMLAIGEGAAEQAQEQFRQLGSKNVILRSVKPKQEQRSDQSMRINSYGLTDLELERITQTMPGIVRAVPLMQVPAEVRAEDRLSLPRVLCTTPSYLEATGRIMQEGRFLTSVDQENRSPVCVLSYEVARFLWPFESTIGKQIKVGPHYLDVVGVLWPRDPVDAASLDSDSEIGGEVFMTLATGRRFFGTRQTQIRSGTTDITEVELHEIVVEVGKSENVSFVADACRRMLDLAHSKKDYEVLVPLELLMQEKESARIFNIVLASIAGISLLVGGIGIMNVMLATVTERTREIGIRRALGAKRGHIVMQFLIETIVLSGCGGFLGVLLGITIPMLVEHYAEMPTIVTPAAPIVAFAISVGVGVIFGLYPAWRAAAMDPVEALRHE
tara:strand:+ start:2646 stop:3920 length:1275 start_codon:yes stop_codon:yes gene_type:complete